MKPLLVELFLFHGQVLVEEETAARTRALDNCTLQCTSARALRTGILVYPFHLAFFEKQTRKKGCITEVRYPDGSITAAIKLRETDHLGGNHQANMT